MKNLSNEQKQEIENFVAELNTLSDEIDTEQDNARESTAKLNEKVQRYNNVVKNARDFRDGVVQKMKDYSNDQPDNWQESEGETYQEWIDAWEEAELIKIELMELPEVEDRDHSGTLEGLPTSCE